MLNFELRIPVGNSDFGSKTTSVLLSSLFNQTGKNGDVYVFMLFLQKGTMIEKILLWQTKRDLWSNVLEIVAFFKNEIFELFG